MRLRDVLVRLHGLRIPRNRYLREQYRKAFGTDEGCVVLQDLYLFAGGNGRDSCIFGKPDHTAYLEGRRSVILYIQKRMRWSDEDMRELLDTGAPSDPLAEPGVA